MLLSRRLLRRNSALTISSFLPTASVSRFPPRTSPSDHIVEVPDPPSLPWHPTFLGAPSWSFSRSFSEGILPKTVNYRSHGDADGDDLLVCPGCGVYLQDENPKLPGFFIKPSTKTPKFHFLSDDEDRKSEDASVSSNTVEEKPVVCARCHSLRYYGRVKDESAENLLPDFDFDYYLGHRLSSSTGSRSVVMMVVDASDFDGSFPRRVARLVSNTIEEDSAAWKKGKPGNVPRAVLVVTKIDLLPSSISPTRLEHWVRQRAREGGSNKLTSVHLVSAVRDWGMKNLIEDIKELVGTRGNVWAVGAQNVGKSTLINAISKQVQGKVMHLTEAPVPGTTLGIIRVEGVFPGQAKLFDTPGILHPYQITTRLTRDEQKLVHISKELRPRTFRVKAGYAVHIGGLLRLDVEEASVETVYLTVWASPYIPLHMGRIEHASTMVEAHFGRQLQPPIGEKRVGELGKWIRREYKISGASWDVNSTDVAAAGLGWFAIGLKGEAVLGVWCYDGIDITVRGALIPDKAKMFETAGFTVSKIVSRADKAINKTRRDEKMKQNEGPSERVGIDQSVALDNPDAQSC
ncbi:GTP-binding protein BRASSINAZOLE INSENSITIVE PALE GREEN 2 [Nymphaea thermarum]|nr:GTP-binding protein BRASSINAZOLE INSENSITIVE PALE GREEN 2 [Nymphaea thermarum]